MDIWTLVRIIHLLCLILFVGGQMAMVVAVSPVMRGEGEQARPAMRAIAKRFGIATAFAIVLLLITGFAMAMHNDQLSDPIVHAKLGLLVLILVLGALHTKVPYARALSLLVFVLSIVMVALGVMLAHG